MISRITPSYIHVHSLADYHKQCVCQFYNVGSSELGCPKALHRHESEDSAHVL